MVVLFIVVYNAAPDKGKLIASLKVSNWHQSLLSDMLSKSVSSVLIHPQKNSDPY